VPVATGTSRVQRGGSRSYYAFYCRVASRYGINPASRFNGGFGFRLVLSE
jgi:formylglycine-generating enzyme required for sulfatase activity